MTNIRSNIAFVRPIVAAALAVTMGFSGVAHAAVERGLTDQVTGQSWIRATTVDEGLSLGYHAASTAEFSAYLTNGGFGAESTTQEFFSRTVSKDLMGFASNANLLSIMPYEYGGPSVALGWLNGQSNMVGAMLHTSGSQMTACPGGYSYNCYTTIYVNEAAYGTLSEMESGLHDRYSYGAASPNAPAGYGAKGGDWVGALAKIKQPDGSYPMSYFMVSSVPEADTLAMLGMGLVAMALTVRRRQSA
jgi:hypothetical protein